MTKRIETPREYLEAFIKDPSIITNETCGVCANTRVALKPKGYPTANAIMQKFWFLVDQQYGTPYPIEGSYEEHRTNQHKYEGEWLEKRIEFAKTMIGVIDGLTDPELAAMMGAQIK